jgi:hypothetical protein
MPDQLPASTVPSAFVMRGPWRSKTSMSMPSAMPLSSVPTYVPVNWTGAPLSTDVRPVTFWPGVRLETTLPLTVCVSGYAGAHASRLGAACAGVETAAIAPAMSANVAVALAAACRLRDAMEGLPE